MDKLLFTPGPLNTSETVKSAMLRDLGSRDTEFIRMVREIREQLLGIAGLTPDDGYEAVLMQGSGTFGIESVISSTLPGEGTLLLIINGHYGERMARMASVHQLNVVELRYDENEIPRTADISEVLKENQQITHVAVVHCETTTGILNPVEEIGKLVKSFGKRLIIDAMSSFGALPLSLSEAGIHFLISSSNKCIEGIPGFSFILAEREALEECRGLSRTVSLDLYEQWKGLETNGQFRFTPPVQALMAFRQAQKELVAEGGVEERGKRYAANHRILLEGMIKMGFDPYIDPEHQAPIITTFLNPKDQAFDFQKFYNELNNRECVIYPGKLTHADSFRIGNIGQLHSGHIHTLLDAIGEVVREMGLRSCSGTRQV